MVVVEGTQQEARFLEPVGLTHGRGNGRVLELECGTGRLWRPRRVEDGRLRILI